MRPISPYPFVPASLVCVAVGLVSVGCGPSLQVTKVEAAHRRPSNVAVYFTVEDRDGAPVADLLSTDFKIYEDGKLVSVDESRQTIVNPDVAAEHYTLLLVDMSASVTESEDMPYIVDAARAFIAQLEKYQRVGVYAFDGSAELHRVSPFTDSEQRSARGIDQLENFRTRDPSTNLHGAVVQALGELDTVLKRSKSPLRFGTLVVFTDGTDRAARVANEDMQEALGNADYDVYAIGVGNEIDDDTLKGIGRDGYQRVSDAEALAAAFERIGNRIISVTRSYYLLSYCSPARAGAHEVTVEAVTQQGARGSLVYEFDAKGFAPGCDPNQPPPFDTARTVRRHQERRGREHEASAASNKGSAAKGDASARMSTRAK